MYNPFLAQGLYKSTLFGGLGFILSLQTPSIDYKKLKVTCCVNATQLSKAVISNPPTSAWNMHYT